MKHSSTIKLNKGVRGGMHQAIRVGLCVLGFFLPFLLSFLLELRYGSYFVGGVCLIGGFIIATIIYVITGDEFVGSSAEDHSEGTFEKLYGKKEK